MGCVANSARVVGSEAGGVVGLYQGGGSGLIGMGVWTSCCDFFWIGVLVCGFNLHNKAHNCSDVHHLRSPSSTKSIDEKKDVGGHGSEAPRGAVTVGGAHGSRTCLQG